MHPAIRIHIELFSADSKRTVYLDMKDIPHMWTPIDTIRWMLDKAGEKFPKPIEHKPRD
jgi:hypothetical protein